MVSTARRSGFARSLALAAVLLVGIAAASVPSSGTAQNGGGGYAWDDPNWRFTMHSRRVKVVLLAGSIGAFRDEPYARLLHEWCGNAEIRNLSRVGFGAWQLYDRFQSEVLDSGRMPFGVEGVETWLMWNGGLNSAGVSHRSNHYIRKAFRDAHRRGMRVVGMSLTPWGGFEDERRWGGARALDTLRNTKRIVGFVLGRGTPRELLGEYASQREVAADAPWTASELADVRIDLFDSPLRHRDAPLRDFAAMRELVSRDARWRERFESLAPQEREAQVATDAQQLAEMGRWFLRPEYRGFDPIHPNRDGHAAIARHACPRLPASWGCECPAR